jgi:hypothetical protein
LIIPSHFIILLAASTATAITKPDLFGIAYKPYKKKADAEYNIPSGPAFADEADFEKELSESFTAKATLQQPSLSTTGKYGTATATGAAKYGTAAVTGTGITSSGGSNAVGDDDDDDEFGFSSSPVRVIAAKDDAGNETGSTGSSGVTGGSSSATAAGGGNAGAKAGAGAGAGASADVIKRALETAAERSRREADDIAAAINIEKERVKLTHHYEGEEEEEDGGTTTNCHHDNIRLSGVATLASDNNAEFINTGLGDTTADMFVGGGTANKNNKMVGSKGHTQGQSSGTSGTSGSSGGSAGGGTTSLENNKDKIDIRLAAKQALEDVKTVYGSGLGDHSVTIMTAEGVDRTTSNTTSSIGIVY